MCETITKDFTDSQQGANSDVILIAAYLEKLSQLELGETL
tara:strand:+ start:332 stop:451 length:120 start_codon:yes stop_codon:yes gene_type:complete